MRGGLAVLVVEIHRVHQIADDVELELAGGVVAGADGRGPLVALEVIEDRLGQLGAAVDAVEHLQARVGAEVAEALLEKLDEVPRLIREPDPEEGVHRERRVPHPGVAIVPVALPADLLRQAHRRCGDDGPGRLECQQLEGQAGTLDHLPPATLVVAPRNPLLPVAQRLVEVPVAALGEGGERRRRARRLLQDHRNLLAFAKNELRGGRVLPQRQGQGRRELETEPAGHEPAAGFRRRGRGALAPVVERRGALQPERQLAADAPDDPNDPVLLRPLGPRLPVDRHEVHDLADALGCEETGDEDVGVGEIHLALSHGVRGGRDPEGPAALRIEDRAEDAGRVEVREAEPVDRSVQSDERDRVKVADDPVMLDRRIAHPTIPPRPPEPTAAGR